MSQATFDTDELFGEAATEIRDDVETHLGLAREGLPTADAIWTADAENTLGVLNGLKQALDVGDAEEHLRDAKKWYTMGKRADAFENAEDLQAEIESIDETIENVRAAREHVGDLTSTLPELRGELDDTRTESDEDDAGADETPAESDEA